MLLQHILPQPTIILPSGAKIDFKPEVTIIIPALPPGKKVIKYQSKANSCIEQEPKTKK